MTKENWARLYEFGRPRQGHQGGTEPDAASKREPGLHRAVDVVESQRLREVDCGSGHTTDLDLDEPQGSGQVSPPPKGRD